MGSISPGTRRKKRSSSAEPPLFAFLQPASPTIEARTLLILESRRALRELTAVELHCANGIYHYINQGAGFGLPPSHHDRRREASHCETPALPVSSLPLRSQRMSTSCSAMTSASALRSCSMTASSSYPRSMFHCNQGNNEASVGTCLDCARSRGSFFRCKATKIHHTILTSGPSDPLLERRKFRKVYPFPPFLLSCRSISWLVGSVQGHSKLVLSRLPHSRHSQDAGGQLGTSSSSRARS